MDAVVGVRRAVEVDVPGVGGEVLFELRFDLRRIGGLGQHLLEEVDVARVVARVELPRRGMAHDHHAARSDQRVPPVQVEVVAQAKAGDEDGVHHRVHVVGTDVGQPHGEDVGLALDLDQLLAVDVLGRHRVHGLDLAGLHAGHLVGRPDRLEDATGQSGRRALEALANGEEAGPVAGLPLPLPLLEEGELLGEGVGVEGALDLEHPDARGRDMAAHAPVRGVQLGAVLVHERTAVLHGAHVVVMAQAPVRRQPRGHALVAAVHGDQVDVDVHEEVALGRPAVDLDVLTLVGGAEVHHAVGILGVVLRQEPVRGEGFVDPIAEGVAQLALGHAPVEGQSSDELDVVDTCGRGHVEHFLDDPLADVGPLHRR